MRFGLESQHVYPAGISLPVLFLSPPFFLCLHIGVVIFWSGSFPLSSSLPLLSTLTVARPELFATVIRGTRVFSDTDSNRQLNYIHKNRCLQLPSACFYVLFDTDVNAGTRAHNLTHTQTNLCSLCGRGQFSVHNILNTHSCTHTCSNSQAEPCEWPQKSPEKWFIVQLRCFFNSTREPNIVKSFQILALHAGLSLSLAFIWPTWSLLNLKYDLISWNIVQLNLIAALKCYFTPMAALGKGQIINIWPQFASAMKVCATAARTTNVGSCPCPFSGHKYLV